MREIKFRAWDECRKKMFYSLFEWDDNYSESFQFINGALKAFVTHDPNPHIAGNGEEIVTYECPIMEFSGILDKHGVEIYEGDICKVHQFLFDGNEVEHETIGVIGHSGTSFTLSEIRSKFIEEHTGYYSGEGEFPLVDFQPIDHLYGLHEESFEIIGNRFQHPELLNAK